jgi:hypothetical protein
MQLSSVCTLALIFNFVNGNRIGSFALRNRSDLSQSAEMSEALQLSRNLEKKLKHREQAAKSEREAAQNVLDASSGTWAEALRDTCEGMSSIMNGILGGCQCCDSDG